jgi:hypothetical protein
MRKSLLHILFLLCVVTVQAQNYQAIKSNMVRFYNGDYGQYGIRIDSVAVVDGDSLLFNIVTIRTGEDNFLTCYYLNEPSMIGRVVVVRPDGETLFLNRQGDTVRVHTQALLNEPWLLMSISADTQLMASVTAIEQEEWLGLNDMVKTITVQAVDGTGQAFDHPANGFTMKIGEQLGLLEGFDLFYFPHFHPYYLPQEEFSMRTYTVSGMEDQGVGLRRVSSVELYDLDLCDEFHFTKTNQTSTIPTPDYTYSKRTVVGKSVGDTTVTYMFETSGCRYHTISVVGINPTYTQVATPFQGVISTVTYPYRLDSEDSVMPSEFALVDQDSSVGPTEVSFSYAWRPMPSYDSFANRQSVSYSNSGNNTLNFYVENNNPQSCGNNECNCWEPYTEGYSRGIAAIGLGTVYENVFNYSAFNDWQRMETDLVYYNKCGVEWGTPHSEGLLTGVNETDVERNAMVNVWPNPANQFITIEWQREEEGEFILLDMTGKEVIRKQSHEQRETIDVSSLSSGLYLLQLVQGEVRSSIRIVVER